MKPLENSLWPASAAIHHDGSLAVGGCSLPKMAERFGTPLYVLDAETIRGQCRAYHSAMTQSYPGEYEIHYAGKALLNIAIAQLVQREGLGLDVVSGGELALALKAGLAPSMIAMHGNAKSRDELEQAVKSGIGHIVIDNLDEIAIANSAAKAFGRQQAVMLRLSPDIVVDTHRHISTGHRSSKFGLPLDQIEQAGSLFAASPNLRLEGLHCHLGSQLRNLQPYTDAIDVMLEVSNWFARTRGMSMTIISPGGGLGIDHLPDDSTPTIEMLVRTISDAVQARCKSLGMTLPKVLLEPGRSIVGRSGIAVYRILGKKHLPKAADQPEQTIVHVDGGMGDNLRPALYGAQYSALVADRPSALPTTITEIAGRYCESGDILVQNAYLPRCETGDTIALAGAGAYTLSMASNYNLVPRPAVLLVDNDTIHLIQRRESPDAMWARDIPLVEM